LLELAFVLSQVVAYPLPPPPSTSKVVNGEEAQPYSWPWQVSLEFHTYRVVVAEHDMNTEEGYEESIVVDKMILHPDWNDNCVSCGNDIALLKQVRSAVINDKVQLACLPESGAILTHNQPCYFTGWGRIYSGGPAANHLQQALLPVVKHSVCSHSDWWGSSAKTTMICAGGESKSACHVSSDGRWYVQGVTSFANGKGCNIPQKPTVFTRVASFILWISQVSYEVIYEAPGRGCLAAE
uniref:Peptidase S1 domain-containing protein n=1 Tax=Salmo trutta TaxID=8032 RepID=A0A673YZ73_SALTR